VTNTLRLLQLPAGVQRALADASITAGHARALLGTPDRALQEALVARIIAEGLTVRGVEDAVRELSEAPEPATPASGTTPGTTRKPGTRRLPEPGLLELEEMLASFLNTRVKVDLRNRRGRLIVDFATLEDLERIYRTMVGNALTESQALPN
jgi:ParB family chromosome partitioning protein